jgi:acyl-lipid omega-6 desaturase (Delta-12 desaturase)
VSTPPLDSDSLVFSVPGGPSAAATARQTIRTQDGWIPATMREDVLLLVTELVTNAVRHGEVGQGRSVLVGVHRREECVKVEVVDAGSGFECDSPNPKGPGGGWGLYFVERLADRWGITPVPTGTCVWFEIGSPGSNDETATDSPAWREALAPYAQPRLGRSVLDLATAVAPYLALSVLMYLALDVSYLLTLALAVPAAGFLLRTYILFHDCAHGSFLPRKRANVWLGRVLGLVVFAPYLSWRHSHAIHHATAGDLDRRGVGDVHTMTVAEYRASPWRRRLGYRLFRNPLVMFGLGPILSLIVAPRLVSRSARPRIRRSVIGTNIALAALVAALCWLIGWRDYLLVQTPTALLAGSAGVWLFYVQHQFEDTYWQSTGEWSYADAGLRGSSYLRLPGLLRFFTGNIGLHHVHHLNAKVPNYNLQRAHDRNPVFHDVPTLSLQDGLRAVRLKLWDEERRRLVSFAQARGTSG